MASWLPAFILDTLVNIPHFLMSIRNALLPVPPRLILPDPAPHAPRVVLPDPITAPSHLVPPGLAPQKSDIEDPVSDQEHQQDPESEAGSEADVESNEGYGSGVGESWISLRDASPLRP